MLSSKMETQFYAYFEIEFTTSLSQDKLSQSKEEELIHDSY
jgi:hypothetical protein